MTPHQTAVDGLRTHGYSLDEIASRLGATRQAAHQRWGTGR
jgi:transcriptional regulator